MDIKSLTIKSLPCVRLCSRCDLPDAPGLYFVIDDRATPVYYIGQAKSLKKRWTQHDKLKVFEHYDSASNPVSIHYLEIDGACSDRIALESQAIARFVPLMNYQVRGFASLRSAKAVHNESPREMPHEEKNGQVIDRIKTLMSDDHYCLYTTLSNEICMGHEDNWFEFQEGFVGLLENFLQCFHQEARRRSKEDKRFPSVGFYRDRVFSLIVATALNKARLNFMAASGLIPESAAERAIGVGSISQTWDQKLMICTSESLNFSRDHEGDDVDLDCFVKWSELPGTQKTVESFWEKPEVGFTTIHESQSDRA